MLVKSHLSYLLSFIAGIALVLAFAPFSLWFFALLSPAVLLYLLNSCKRPKHAFLMAYCFGLGLFGFGVSWVYVSIHDFGQASPPLAVLLTCLLIAGLSVFYGLLGLAYQYSKKFFDSYSWILSFPFLWLATEVLISHVLTGFPWLLLGYSMIDTSMVGLAPIIGVFGLSFLVLLLSALLYKVLTHIKCYRLWLSFLLVSILFFGFGHVWSLAHWTTKNSEPLTVALIQGNTSQDLKWTTPPEDIFSHYLNLTQPYLESDIIVWPEAAITLIYPYSQPWLEYLDQLAMNNRSTLITGLLIKDPNTQAIYNSMMMVGLNNGIYYKSRLVPFGEYVPFEKWLRGLIHFFDLPTSQISHFNEAPKSIGSQNLSFGPFICYEVAYPQALTTSIANADILITISNDAWFGRSIGPSQHLQISRMRAAEAHRYMIRATNNGITAIINPKGEIVAKAPVDVATVLIGEVIGQDGQTPIGEWGYRPLIIILAIIYIIFGLYFRFIKPNNHHQ